MEIREMVIFGEIEQDDNGLGEYAHFSMYAFKDEPDIVHICITGQVLINENNFNDFLDIFIKAGIWLGYTDEEITEIMEIEVENAG